MNLKLLSSGTTTIIIVKLHSEQDSKAQRMALTAAVTLIQFIRYAYNHCTCNI